MPKSRPWMFLIAGGPGQIRRRGADPLLQTVLHQAGVEKPRVAYVGAASRDNPAFRLLIAGMLTRAGAGEVTLAPMCGRRFDPSKTRHVLENADLVFISGGDVEEGMTCRAGGGNGFPAAGPPQGGHALLRRLRGPHTTGSTC